MARKVFISVLGFTNYGQCSYVKGDYKSSSIRFIQEATLDYLCKQCEWSVNDVAYILLTNGAEKANWHDDGHKDRETGEVIKCEGLCSRLQKMNLPFVVNTIKNLPDGNTEEEIWNIFERVFNELQDEDELYFDLTHGFRYLPMLVMVLINYSKFLKNTSVKSITYGNYESRNKVTNEAPIIDLLPLSALQDWTYAAGQFLDSGNVQRLIKLNKDAIKPIMILSAGKDENAVKLTGYTNYLNSFVGDMQTCRGLNIIQSTNLKKLMTLTNEIQSTFIKPLNPIFDKIRNKFQVFDIEGNILNTFIAAQWCADNGLYQQAITILQEGIQTLICSDCGYDILDKDIRMLVSGTIVLYTKNTPEKDWTFPPQYTLERIEEAKKCMREMLKNKELQRFAKIYASSTEFRNDLNHSGMRSTPKDANNIQKGIQKVISQAILILKKEAINGVYEFSSKCSIFLNLTNHPSFLWNDKQREAARVYGEIMDMSFPAIDETDDETYISTLADEYLQKILDLAKENNVTVHLMGELNFTFALLKRLQEHGIMCVASTSKRIVKEEEAGRKGEVIFQFERFRRYE